MSEFDYRPQPGILSEWSLSVSGHDDPVLNGPVDILPPRQLVEVEIEIRTWQEDYAEETGARLTRVHGGSGCREFEWDNGEVHRFEWSHELTDMRCPRCRRPEVTELYMVTDEVWAAGGFNSWECWHCLEEVLGRRLQPRDFRQDLPANTDQTRHSEELRARIGLT